MSDAQRQWNPSQGADGRTRIFVLHTERLDDRIQALLLLLGCALRLGELITQFLDRFLEIQFLFI